MVAIIGWPDDDGRRDELRRRGAPRLLLVAPGVPPPDVYDPLEDWIRTPADDRDVAARVDALRARAATRTPVAVLEGTVLRVGDRTARLAPIQATLVDMLLARRGMVVPRDELLRAGWPARTAPRNALDVQVMRLRKRVAPLGLWIQSIRGRGYLLAPATAADGGSPGGQILFR